MKVLDDYVAMRREMLSFMCHELGAGTIPMDLSSMTIAPGEAPSKKAVAAAHDIIKMAEGNSNNDDPTCGRCATQPQSTGKEPLECWNCGGPQSARMCDQPLKKEVQERIKGIGKG